MRFDDYVPQILLEDEDYQVFLSIIGQISTDIRSLIQQVPELVDVDNAPDIFLPKLAALVRYQIRQDLSIDYQREVIKRIIEIYRARGTDDEIIMSATYGDYEYWVGSHLFYPDAEVDREKAELLIPIDEVFRHSRSKFSGTDRYPGSTLYREGTIVVKLTYVNDQIRRAINKVVPAGIRIYYYLASDTSEDTGFYVDFGEWEIETSTSIHIELEDADLKLRVARRSHPQGARSSHYVFSGTLGNRVEFVSDDLPIMPYDSDYPVALVGDKFVGDSRGSIQNEIEVKIIQDS